MKNLKAKIKSRASIMAFLIVAVTLLTGLYIAGTSYGIPQPTPLFECLKKPLDLVGSWFPNENTPEATYKMPQCLIDMGYKVDRAERSGPYVKVYYKK